MGLVDEDDEVVGKVVQEDGGTLAHSPAGKGARVVLDAGAVADLLEHLDVVLDAALEPLLLHELALALEVFQLVPQLVLDAHYGLVEGLARHDELLGRVEREAVKHVQALEGDGVEDLDPDDLVPVEPYPDGRLEVGRVDLDDVAPHTEGASGEDGVVALVEHAHQLVQLLSVVEDLPHRVGVDHVLDRDRVAQAVYAAHRRDDDHVAPLHQGEGGRKAQPVDLVVDVGLLLYVEVLARHIGLWLVVVVGRDEVLDRVVGEEGLELPVQLGRQRLVVGQDQGGPVHPLDDLGHREGLARAGDALERLGPVAGLYAPAQRLDGGPLVTRHVEWGHDLEVPASGHCTLMDVDDIIPRPGGVRTVLAHLITHLMFSAVCSTRRTSLTVVRLPFLTTVTSTSWPALLAAMKA